MKTFNKILIANRGEIAVRVIRSAQLMGIKSVAVYSSADQNALHVRLADEAYSLGETVELSETYLDIEKIIGIAQKSACEAIHPGYGFLSENPLFVAACEKAGIVFIGPNSRSIELMGNKIESRKFVKKLGIPMTEARTGNKASLMQAARDIPFPLLVKAAAGGGGKGMRIVYDEKELESTIESTSREAQSYFGDGTVFVEKYLEQPRHIEIQVIGDNHGNAVHLFERECSIQRRYQKIIEESPSPTISHEVRMKMGEAAVRITKEIGYNNAGTVEFLVDKDLNFYFLEMNTRVQVEHPVTEMVTGVDIVHEQILIAAGNPLSLKQEELTQKGHAIECRIYAEDPSENFLPSPGEISFYQEPSGEDIRVDAGLDNPTTIHSFYDPMISKLVVWGKDRDTAIKKSIAALNDYHIHGIKTNIAFLKEMLYHPAYVNNQINTKFCDKHTVEIISLIKDRKNSIPLKIAAAGFVLLDLHTKNNSASIWDQIGYWREIMNIPVAIEDAIINVHIEGINGNAYRLLVGEEKFEAKILNSTEHFLIFSVDDHKFQLTASQLENGEFLMDFMDSQFRVKRKDVLVLEDFYGSADSGAGGDGKITSPMPGKVIKIVAREGEKITKGDILMVVEAMKMENNIIAPRDAVVEKINVKSGEMVTGSTELLLLQDR